MQNKAPKFNNLTPYYTMSDTIDIIGAETHNLKNITVSIPKNTLTVVTGVSGSGKSSLAFETLYAE
jgi:excinuclease ABC subunit A